MAPVADAYEEPAAAAEADEASDAPVADIEESDSQNADQNRIISDNKDDDNASKEDAGSEDVVVDEKSSEIDVKTAESDDLGGGKEVDESATESIAQPDTPEEAQWAAEEVQGPELTSDSFLTEEAKEIDLKNALYERMNTAVASAESEKKDKDRDKDPIVDTVVSVAAPVIYFAVSQAQMFKESVAETTDVAVRAACNQLGQIQDTSTMHYYQAQDMFWRFKRDYNEYEHTFFSTLKDGVKAAAANPGMATALAAGAALVFLRRPRRFLFRHTLGRFRSQESMVASAEKKVQDLRAALNLQKNEKRKLEERFRLAEEEFLRGQSKMSNAGGQIRPLVKSMYKTERLSQRLLEKLRDLSGKPAVQLRGEVASMASEVKQQRSTLDKTLYKIAGYNIRV